MKMKANIEIIDDKHDLAHYEKFGFSKEVLMRMYKEAWTLYLDGTVYDELRYTLNVDIAD